MFIICDNKDVIQDIASDKANLSRGYQFAGHKLYENIDIFDGTIGDVFKDGQVLINETNKQERELRSQQESMITAKSRELAIVELKREGKLPPDFE